MTTALDNVEDVYGLTPLQEGMLYHTLAAPGSGVFVQQIHGRFVGELDRSVFEQAWTETVHRHAALRSVFLWEQLDEPLQIVRQKATVPVTYLDWRDLSSEHREQRCSEYLRDDRQRGFILSQAPLMRLALVHEATNRYRWIWSFHHLIADGWSTPLVIKDVFAHCDEIQHNEQIVLDRPTFRFGDYLEWLAGQDLVRAEEFWRESLSGFRTPTRLQFCDERRERGNDQRGHQQIRNRLTTQLTSHLRLFAAQQRLTLNTLVHGAYALLLSRYSGHEDVVYGATVSGRPPTLPGVERAVGLFINTLPVRVHSAADATVNGWLQKLQTTLVQIREFEFSPLARVQAWSDVPRGNPLFETLVAFENYPEVLAPDAASGLPICEIEYLEQSNLPFALVAVPGNELELIAVYDSGRFAADFMIRLLDHLETLLQAIVESPHSSLSALPLLTEAERAQRSEWNNTLVDATSGECLHELIEQQASKTPDAVAVEFEDHRLTYRTLNDRANHLALQLQNSGVAPDVCVGLCCERSPEMVVGLLGILKAGGAFLPLDPNYPAEHLRILIEDADPPVLLVQTGASIPQTGRTIIQIDSHTVEDESNDGIPSPSGTNSDHLAYVIHTSGSTGVPKGVAISHRSIVNSTRARREVYPSTPSRFLLLSSFSFDSSLVGIFWTLCEGGTLVLPISRIEQEMPRLLDMISAQRITHTLCLPSLYRLILDHSVDNNLASLKTVIVAGESCPSSLVKLHHERIPAASLYNEYGPTEASVWSTARKLTPADADGTVSIGRPIPNVRVHLLDRHRQPVPVGIIGEIHLAGAGLAREYLNRPDFTAERFVTLRLGDGERAYRTGDLAYHRADGDLVFVGRSDAQVKIRGHRIELQSVEDALKQHPQIDEAAVVARSVQLPEQETSMAVPADPDRLAEQLGLWDAPAAMQLLSEIEQTPDAVVTKLLAESGS